MQYPHEYRIGRGRRSSVNWMAVICFALGLGAFLWGFQTGDHDSMLGAVVFSLVPILVGLDALLRVLRSRVVLTADAIEVRSIVGAKRLKHTDIAGWRRVEMGNGPLVLVFEARSGKRKALRIPHGVQFDAELEAWIAAFPNLET